MTIAREITFHGVSHRRDVEILIEERIDRLPHWYDRVQSCRVVVEAPHRAHGALFSVRIEVGVPGRDPLVVTQQSDHGDPRETLPATVRDAFSAAERKLRDLHGRLTEKNRAG